MTTDPETTERFAKLMCERDAEIVRLKFQSNAHRDAQIEGLQEIATLRARLASAENVVEAAKNLRTRLAVTRDGFTLLMRGNESLVPLLMRLAEKVDALAAHAQSQPEKK